MENNTTNKGGFRIQTADFIPLVIWLAVLFMTWLFMHGADRYLQLTPEALGKYFKLRWVLIIHITTGGGALITGIIQFWQKLRNYNITIHRIIGFLYLLAVLISSFCALVLAFSTAYKISWAYAFTLQVWASIWISATFIAYYAILRKNFGLHKEWMTRSYIITVSFLISGFAFKIPYVQQFGTPEEVYIPLFWMGWAVPLYAFEVIRSSKLLNKQKSEKLI